MEDGEDHLYDFLAKKNRVSFVFRYRRSKESVAKVIDVALDSGFESVDGFQRAFYREFGCNPGTYSTHPVPYFIPYGVKFQNRHFNACKTR